MAERDFTRYLTEEIDPKVGTVKATQKASTNPELNIAKSARNITVEPTSYIGEKFYEHGGYQSIDKKLRSTDLGNIPEARVQAQTGMELLGKFLWSGASAIVTGIAQTPGYLYEIGEWIAAEDNASVDFTNAYIEALDSIKESIQEPFPIYMSETALNGTLKEKLGDGTYWASQGETVATTVSLLFPAIGSGMLVGAAARAIGAGAKAARMAAGIGASLVSRSIENGMEASQVFKERMNELAQDIESGVISEHDARISAGNAAANTWKANSAMVAVDMLQYTTLLKPALGFKKAAALAKATEPVKFRTAKELGKVMLTEVPSEAAEEFYQHVASQEALHAEKEGVSSWGGGFFDRMADYLVDEDAQEAALLGGLMGGVFGSMGPVARRATDLTDKRGARKLIAANLNDMNSFNKIDTRMEGELIGKNLTSNRLDRLRSDLENFYATQSEKSDMTDVERSAMRTKIDDIKTNINFVEDADNTLASYSRDYADNTRARHRYVMLKLEDNITKNRLNDLKGELSNLEKNFTPEDKAVLLMQRVLANEKSLNELEKAKIPHRGKKANLFSSLMDAKIAMDRDAIAKGKESVNEAISKIRETNPTFKWKEHSIGNIEKIKGILSEQAGLSKTSAFINADLNIFENMLPNEIKEENSRLAKEAREKIRKSKESFGKTLVEDANSPRDLNNAKKDLNDPNINNGIQKAINAAGQSSGMKKVDNLWGFYKHRFKVSGNAQKYLDSMGSLAKSIKNEWKKDNKGLTESQIDNILANLQKHSNSLDTDAILKDINVPGKFKNVIDDFLSKSKESFKPKQAGVTDTKSTIPTDIDIFEIEETEGTKPILEEIYPTGDDTAPFMKNMRELHDKLYPIFKDINNDKDLDDKRKTDLRYSILNLKEPDSIEAAQFYIDTLWDHPIARGAIKTFFDVESSKAKTIKSEVAMPIEIGGHNENSAFNENENEYSEDEVSGEKPIKAAIQPGAVIWWEYEFKPDADGNMQVVYDSTGRPMPNPLKADFTLDWKKLNDPAFIKQGDTVTFHVNMDSLYGPKELGSDDFGILVYHVAKDGSETLLGPLMTVSNVDQSNEQLIGIYKNIRQQIFDKSKGKKGIFKTGLYTTISKKHAGRINRSDKTLGRYSPSQILKGKEMIFGVSKGVKDSSKGTIVVNNSKHKFANENKLYPSGAVYMQIEGANGDPIYVRCFTKKVRQMANKEGNPTMFEQIVIILSQMVDKKSEDALMPKLRELISPQIKFNHKDGTFTLDKSNLVFTRQDLIDMPKELSNAIGDYTVQVDVNKINYKNPRTGEDYNKDIVNERVVINIDPNAPIHSTRFDIDLTTIVDKAPKAAKRVAKPKKEVITIPKADTSPEVKIEQKPVRTRKSPNVSGIQAAPVEVVSNPTEPLTEGNSLDNKGVGKKKTLKGRKSTLKINDNNFTREKPAPQRLAKKVISKEDAKAWLESVLPEQYKTGEWFQYVDGLVEVASKGKIAWGLANNASISLSSLAEIGTEYHEAFHVIFNLMLDEKRMSSIIDEARKRYNTTDWIETEEKLADEFSEWMLNRGNYTGVTGRIRKFFEQLYYYITSNIFGFNNAKNLFSQLERGAYKNAIFEREVNFTRLHKAQLPGIPPSVREDMIQSVADMVSEVITTLNNQEPQLQREDIIRNYGIEEILDAAYDSLLDTLESDEHKDFFEANPTINDYYYEMLENFLKTDENGDRFETPVLGVIGELALRIIAVNEGIRIRLSETKMYGSVEADTDTETDNMDEIDEERNQLEGWQIDTEKISLKNGAPAVVRRELSRIPNLNPKTGKRVLNALSRPTYLNPSSAWAYIMTELADINSSDEMVSELERVVNENKAYTELLNKVNTDELFRTKFFNAVNNTQVEYLMAKEVRVGKEIQRQWFSSNRERIDKIIATSWRSTFGDASFNALIDIIKPSGDVNPFLEYKLSKFKSKWDTIYKNINTKNRDALHKQLEAFVNHVGIDITTEELSKMDDIQRRDRNKTKKSLTSIFMDEMNYIFNVVAKGSNPFETNTEATAIRNASKAVAAVRSDLQENSFRRGDNKPVYAHQIPFFLSKQIARMNATETPAAREAAEDYIDQYLSTPFYSKMPFLHELRDNPDIASEFKYAILDTYKGLEDGLGKLYTNLSPKELELTKLTAFYNNSSSQDSSYAWYMMPAMSDSPRGTFVQMPRIVRGELVAGITQIAQSEYNRILQARQRRIDNVSKIKNFDEGRGEKFVLLPFMNDHIKLFDNGDTVGINNAVAVEMSKLFNQELSELQGLGIIRITRDKTSNEQIVKFAVDGFAGASNNPLEFLGSYFYNHVYNVAQMIAIFQGDPAFNTNSADWFKRSKESVSPGKPLDTSAKFILTKEQSEREKAELAKIDQTKSSNIQNGEVVTVGNTYNAVFVQDENMTSTLGSEVYQILLDEGATKEIAASTARVFGYDPDTDKYTVDAGIKSKAKKTNITDGSSIITLSRYRSMYVGAGKWTKEMQDSYWDMYHMESNPDQVGVSLDPIKPFGFMHRMDNSPIIPTQIKDSQSILLPSLAYARKAGKPKRPDRLDRENNYEDYKSPYLARLLNYMEYNNIDALHHDSTIKKGVPIEELIGGGNPQPVKIQSLNNDDVRIQQETPNHYTDGHSNIGTQARKHIISGLDLLSDELAYNLDGKNVTSKKIFDTYQDLVSGLIQQGYNSVDDIFNYDEDDPKSVQDAINGVRETFIEEARSRGMGEEVEKALDTYTDAEGRYRFKLPLWFPTFGRNFEYVIGSILRKNIVKHNIKGGAATLVPPTGFTPFDNPTQNGVLKSDELHYVIEDGIKYVETYLPWSSRRDFEIFADKDGFIDIKKIEAAGLDKLIGYRIPTEGLHSMLPMKIKGFLPIQMGASVMVPAEITGHAGSDYDIDKLYLMSYEYEIENGKFKKYNFNYSRPAISQEKEEINNAIIDIFWSVLTSRKSFTKWMKPSSFDELKTLRNRIVESTGRRQEIANLTLPNTARNGYELIMSGNDLISIFASQSIVHSVLQYANINIDDSMYHLNINGESFTRIDPSDKGIQQTLGMVLAAVVDNVKDPVAGEINLNPITAGVASTLIRLGYDLDTVFNLLNQPIIVDFVNKLKLTGNVYKEFDSTMEEIDDRWFKEVKDVPEDLLNMAFRNGVMNNNMIKNLNGNLTPEGKDKVYVAMQLGVLREFRKARNIAQELRNVDAMTRLDNTSRPITTASNYAIGRTLKKIKDSDMFSGALEFLDDYSDIYPFARDFYNASVIKSDALIEKWLPWGTQAIRNTRDMILNSIQKDKNIGEIDIYYMNYELMNYVMSGYDFFNVDRKYKNTDKTLRKYLTDDFPRHLHKAKETYPELKDNKFINHIQYEKADKNYSKAWLRFRHAGKMSEIDKNEISRSWMDLFDSNNAKVKELANNLMRYTFMNYGFYISPRGWTQYTPVDMLSELGNDTNMPLSKFITGAEDSFINEHSYPSFIDQFFRNNWDNEKYVPKLPKGKYSISKKEGTVSINPKERSITASNIESRVMYVNVKDELYGYIRDEVDKKNPDMVVSIYSKIKKFGVSDYAKEYSYFNFETKIEENNVENGGTADPTPKAPVDEVTQAEATKKTNKCAISFEEGFIGIVKDPTKI